MPNCMEKIKILQVIHAKQQQKINDNDQIFADSACQNDRDHQDHPAFGIEVDQNLRFQKG